MLKSVQERVKVTFQVAAGLAESLGAPPVATSILQRLGGLDQEEDYYQGAVSPMETYPAPAPPPPPPPAPAPEPEPDPEPVPDQKVEEPEPEKVEEPEPAKAEEPAPEPEAKPAAKRPATKRREMVGDKSKSKHVAALKVDDAINGSTYLARIIWALGIAELEDIGPLRPADMARMIMARSPVSLEPPNVARYIRRSKPESISVDHKEGSSSFYKLSDKGHELFKDKYVD
jgi:outer membrane biosynthesis protein TonB